MNCARATPSTLAQLSGQARRKARGAKRLVRRTLASTRRALSAPPIILCYHRVFEPERDPHLLSVRPANFRAHLEVIRRTAKPLALGELANGRRPPRGVVITFDDGYLDNLGERASASARIRHAGDDLPRHRIHRARPGILVGRSRTAHAGRGSSSGSCASANQWSRARMERGRSSDGKRLVECAACRTSGRRAKSFSWNCTPRCGRSRNLCNRTCCGSCATLTGSAETSRPLHRCVNEAEVKTLAAEPLLTLGAHTITHCDLDFRTAEEQQAEIAGSQQQLEEIVGQTEPHFSYPYGSFNQSAVAVCAANHFRSAVTCVEGAVERRASPHELPRYLVRDWDGPEFERQLRAWFRG